MTIYTYPESLIWQAAFVSALMGYCLGQALRAIWRYLRRPRQHHFESKNHTKSITDK